MECYRTLPSLPLLIHEAYFENWKNAVKRVAMILVSTTIRYIHLYIGLAASSEIE
jgi:hypothetical protein